MYENPITIICQGIQTQMVQRDEQMILEAIQKQNVFIDKEELIKAMNYDRNQYSKGYKDGVSEVLGKIRAEIEQYEHYLELLDVDMKDGSATIVTKTKYAVYAEVVKQLKEVLESEVQS
jgi:aminopeptidase N